MTNCVESIEVMYAIWHAGLCAVPMNAKLHAKEFAFILENSGARLCFVTPDLATTIAEAAREAPDLKEIVDTTTRAYSFMAVGDPSAIADCEPTDLAWLFYTSGTTGRSKAAVLTHGQMAFVITNHLCDLLPGATEAECLRASRRKPQAADRQAFARVVRIWQYAAYAERLPGEDEFEALLGELQQRYGWAS